MNFTALWIDDQRPIPSDLGPEWCSARSAHEALLKLELLQFNVVSFDHDLATRIGNKELTGLDILNWLVQRKFDGAYVPGEIRIHTANPVGRKVMLEIVKQYWS